jgi:hypothetical protein
MSNPHETSLATLMNAHELISRVFSMLAGREISSRVEGVEHNDPFVGELVTAKINQCLSAYTGGSVK